MHVSLGIVPLLVSAVVAQSATWHRVPNRSAGRATLAYDAARERMVLVEEHANETLRTFELAGDVWTLRDSTLGARRLFETTYDPVRRRVVLFGGERWPWTLTDAWEWDGRAWRGLPSFPLANDGQRTLVFDPATGSCLVHANLPYAPSPPIRTYLLQANGWTQAASGGPTTGPQEAFVAAGDPVRRRTVLFTNSMWSTPQPTSVTGSGTGRRGRSSRRLCSHHCGSPHRCASSRAGSASCCSAAGA